MNSKKISVNVPTELLRRAQVESGLSISGTVRKGLQLLSESYAYSSLRKLRGKVKFSKTAEELRE